MSSFLGSKMRDKIAASSKKKEGPKPSRLHTFSKAEAATLDDNLIILPFSLKFFKITLPA